MMSGTNYGTRSESWAKESPYECFFDFIAPDADRYCILSEHIEKLGLNSVVIPIEGNRHFFIFPRGQIQKPSARAHPGETRFTKARFAETIFPFHGQKPVVLTAHYDRVPGSPGANDNSAAVFQLLKAAIRLGEQNLDNWIIIFTDKEELQKGEGISVQGSFSLAKKLKSCGLGSAHIFNFDACGAGNTFIFSNTVNYLINKNNRLGLRRASQTIKQLREKAQNTARFLRFTKTLLVPTPFSDDAGFLQGGIPAQTITMLPAAEASNYAAALRDRPDLADLIIAGAAKDSAASSIIPDTWRRLNSPADTHLRLTPEYYDQIVRFAVELCHEK